MVIHRCLIAVLLTACTSTGWRTAAISVSAVDIGTTAYGLHHGYSEANPIYSHQAIPRAIVLNLALIWTIDRLTHSMDEDHKKQSWEWVTLIRAIPVIWNLKMLSESK